MCICHCHFVEYGILQNATANRRTFKKYKVLYFAERVSGKVKNFLKNESSLFCRVCLRQTRELYKKMKVLRIAEFHIGKM